ncbi:MULTISPECIES: putative quinol monooxygenase [Actinoalloteichus]|uniref:ABM domain-containing protein n=1 Tax=Actinoalloteichus fjordicus TaxID=1612552 RepID=A0AAC9LBZ6_9PSEU|nr:MULTISPECIES: putative quinol monooxygenase [Actinoalloteichus]APU13892.1 hypothetical protein UA74_09140 [Actinoalloteichus fjordicus]APU19838.1 hypothetical protein UA75_09110 [Actinoalloteichus sp. GBA129-24]
MFGYLASMRTTPGHRDRVIALLTGGVDGLRALGCTLYLVGASATDDDVIWVTEVWESREHHEASLSRPEVRAAIAEARPMLTGDVTSAEFTVAGGLGI